MKKIKKIYSFVCFIVIFSLLSCTCIQIYALPDEDKAQGVDLELECRSAILMEAKTGKVLYEHQADLRLPPASVTKIMTILLVVEALDKGNIKPEDVVQASERASKIGGSQIYLKAGEEMTVRDFLYCALMVSANEACNALAVNDSGSVEAFVNKMNEKAAELGCEDTHFSDTHGIYHDDHYTTARDMYRIFSAVIADPILSEIITTPEYVVPKNNKSEERELYNTNMLIDPEGPLYYEYALGGKTGYTEEAGCCLVSAAEKDGDKLVCIVMGADFAELDDGRVVPGSFVEAKELYEWCYSEYGDQPLIDPTQPVASLPVKYGKDVHSVDVVPKDGTYVYMRRSEAEKWVTYEVKFKKDTLRAPVRAGQKVGTIEAVYNGELIGSSKLVAAEDVSFSLKQMFIENTVLKVVVFFLAVFALKFIISKILFRKR
jgi:D-alanyl-D-alanine carboxypeptidase (penicillin-binding protein 5/6)